MNTRKKIDLQLLAEEADAEDVEENAPGDKKENKNTDKSKAKYTDEDVDRIINKKFAEFKKKQSAAVDEAKKLAEMDATQKAEYEANKVKKELEELKTKATLADMNAQARKMLANEEITVTDELLGLLVTTDAEETKGAVDNFVSLFKGEVEKAVKEALKGKSPKKNTKGSLTKEKIMDVKDPVERQKLIAENIELFQ